MVIVKPEKKMRERRQNVFNRAALRWKITTGK
jgi:hypothetical protein